MSRLIINFICYDLDLMLAAEELQWDFSYKSNIIFFHLWELVIFLQTSN